MAVGVSRLDVASDVRWAATDDALDNLPLRALRWLGVGGDRELARSTSVNSRACEGNGLGLAGVPLVHLSDVVNTGALLAWVVAGSERRAVQSSLSVWNGVVHDHVRGGTGSECQDEVGLGKHVEVGKSGVRSRYSRLDIARPAER